MRPRSLRNTLWIWAAYGNALVVGFFLAPFVVHRLGDTAYGIWALLGSVVSYLNLLDLGIRSAVSRYVARLHAMAADDEASTLASTALALFLAVGALAVLTSVTLSLVLDRVFQIPPQFLAPARVVLLLSGLTIAFALVGGVYGGVITALQRFDLSSGVEISMTLARAGATVVLLSRGYGLVALSVIYLSASALQLLIQWRLAGRLYFGLSISPHRAAGRRVKEIFSFGLYSTFLHVSQRIIYATDAFVIGAYMPVGFITPFAIAASLRDRAASAVSAIAQPAGPRATSLQALNQNDELARLVLRTARIASLVLLPIPIAFILRGATFIGVWMGPEYVGVSGPLLVVLSVPLLFSAPQHVVSTVFVGLARHRRLAPFYVAEALMNLALSVYWVRSLGLLGVALGTVVPRLLVSALVVPVLVSEELAVGYRAIMRHFWGVPFLALLPYAGLMWVTESVWHADTLLMFFAQILAVLPVGLAGAWWVGLSRGERGHLYSVARARATPRRR